ncbi:MAG: hypothetical protein LiPW15_466 [Parcubacteria group bacterium LiPW_15]|nr:MAG: hypothetical protein LiPW15_466 [Parcubacteria group bacterium LiPW_15]
MITYNPIIDHARAGGWQMCGTNSVLLLQDAFYLSGTKARGGTDPLLDELEGNLSALDKIVVYLGGHDSERIVEFIKAIGAAPDRTIFLVCDCNWVTKMEAIQKCGFSGSEMMECCCGGFEKMENIYWSVLRHGTISG